MLHVSGAQVVAIVETGSLAASARSLNRSPPSVTRDLADLERRIGTLLVERSSRNCRPTPTGLLLADSARSLLTAYDEAIDAAQGEASGPQRSLRVTAPVTFGSCYVVPLVLDLLDAHQGLSIDLRLEDRIVDLVDEDIDLAVRFGALRDSSLMARKIGALPVLVVASPDYLRARGVPRDRHDLAEHDVLQHRVSGIGNPMAPRLREGVPAPVETAARFAVNQPEAALSAARRGRGIVTVLGHQVAKDLKAGRLVEVLADHREPSVPVSLVWPASRGALRRVRLLIDHLYGGLREVLVSSERARRGDPLKP